MIKYIGSKRRLVPLLTDLFVRSGASSALDMFSGTTRVAQAFKEQGAHVTAVDITRYGEVIAGCYVATDSDLVDHDRLTAEVERLNSLAGRAGYFTETFCCDARYVQPFNGERVDAIRNDLESRHDDPLFPVLLTSLIEATDRVDSTTGVQMAYLKNWAPRSHNHLDLRVPHLLPGPGAVVRGNAVDLAAGLGPFDLAYLDPPYNQHRYIANYHVWETLVAWDAPEHYGIANKRVECREPCSSSPFNHKPLMPDALRRVIADVDARIVVLSYNNESWLGLDELIDACSDRGHTAALAFESGRYVGATIGVHNREGRKVGTPGCLRNLEYVLVAGPEDVVEYMVTPYGGARVADAA
ncbi:MAG: DNA adenine methylase [Acidimicrobiales bacterium]|nr:DNA adenine methylase [Acidimicrobiales bacterium]